MTASLAADPRPGDFAVFFAGYMLAALLWCFFISALIAWGRRFVSEAFFRGVNLLCALALASFGLRLGWSIVRLLACG